VVIGLGVLGQLTVQLLKLSACRVIGIDLEQRRIDKVLSLCLDVGFNPIKENTVEEVIKNTSGNRADSVLITAASSSSTLINEAMEICKKR